MARVTKAGSPDFVPPAEHIAVFDNDGTLWSEQPMYFQLAFAIDRVKSVVPEHPEWATARHPRFDRPYSECVFQPMLELLAYLRANGIKTFIASGGGIDFMRVFTERVYGIPPEQVVGSVGELAYEVRDGQPLLIKQTGIFFIDDKAGKPVGIHKFIGRRPIAAFGNSDGDFQMLEWTTSGPGARLGLFVNHDDAEREWAYDRDSSIGRLARGLDEAADRGWVVVSMKNDWKRVFPWEARDE